MLPAVYRNSSIEWKPSPIVALATSPDDSQVAAAREDGSLEIWLVVPSVGWHCQLTIHGDPRSRVSALVWCRAGLVASRCDRLLSSSIDGSISEWDLLQLNQKVILESIEVSIWQIAVAPSGLRLHKENERNSGGSNDSESGESEFDSNDPNLAVACDDGCVRIYSIPDSGELIYQRNLTTANGRVLSVTWNPDASLIYSGSNNGLIRCWDVNSGHEKYRITVGLGAVDSGMPICVWSLLALRCGTLVSADNSGSVRFWESQRGTLIQTHSCHKGDVNALAASPSHNRVFSAGSDGQVILYELSSSATMKKWVYVGNARAHTHDIKALTIAMPISQEDMLYGRKVKRTRRRRVFESSFHNWAHLGVPMLISAGDDAKLFAYSEQKFASPHDICPVPRRLPIQLVRNTVFDNRSLILVQGSCSLDIYCVRTKSGTRSDMGPGTSRHRATLDLMARIKAESSGKIICSTISNSGMLFAYSNHTNPNLFELKKHGVGRNQWTVNKMQLPEKLPYALSMIFSSDSSRLLIAGHDRRIYIVKVRQAKLVHTFIPHHDEKKELQTREHPITKMFTSSDGRWLAAIDCIGGICVFNLETQRQHWFISRLNGASVTAGGFPPQDNNVLVVVTSSNQVYEFDVEMKWLGKWSMQHTSGLPKRFQEFSGEVIGLSFFAESRSPSVMIYSARAMCLIDFGMPVDREEDYNKENVQQPPIKKLQSRPINGTLKRKCEDFQTEAKQKRNFELHAFRDPALFMGHLSEDSILVIDKPWIDVVKAFDTAPVHRHIYGT